jgi:hypothetical protein
MQRAGAIGLCSFQRLWSLPWLLGLTHKSVDSINKLYINIITDRKYNDPKDPNRLYYRSDHYNFAAKGVPIVFFFDGIHKDYHKPSDTPDKINYDLHEKRTRLVFFLAWEAANRNNLFVRDIPLNVPPR